MNGTADSAAEFPWLCERHGTVTLLRRPEAAAEPLLALLRENTLTGNATGAALGRSGAVRVDDPALGALRIKRYARGGWLGKFLPECGLDEAAARRELAGEAALRAAGLLTQETLAMAVQTGSPRLRSIQRFFPDETTYAELKFSGRLSMAQQTAAGSLLDAVWRAGWLHHDANGGNLLWNEAAGRWRIIDLASLRPLSHPWPGGPVAMMRRRLDKPPRAFRNNTPDVTP